MLLVVDNGSIYTEHLIDFLSNQKAEYETRTVGETSVRDWAETSTETVSYTHLTLPTSDLV